MENSLPPPELMLRLLLTCTPYLAGPLVLYKVKDVGQIAQMIGASRVEQDSGTVFCHQFGCMSLIQQWDILNAWLELGRMLCAGKFR